MALPLDLMVTDFARGMELSDARRPAYKTYQPGLGPHTEPAHRDAGNGRTGQVKMIRMMGDNAKPNDNLPTRSTARPSPTAPSWPGRP